MSNSCGWFMNCIHFFKRFLWVKIWSLGSRELKVVVAPIDALTSDTTPSILAHKIMDQPLVPTSEVIQPRKHNDLRYSNFGEFKLAAYPSIVLHGLTACDLDPHELARLEATCLFFRQPANFEPHKDLSLSELAALEMCRKRAIFRPMCIEGAESLKLLCGGSWKLALKFLLAGEACDRRGKSQAIAGPGHSIVVTANGAVYSFGLNLSGQLGLGTLVQEEIPHLIRSLQGIRIIQAAAGAGKTMLVSDTGAVYAFGLDSFNEALDSEAVPTPRRLESLRDIFVVQATIGKFLTAVLSREGRVYTFSWGQDARLGHRSDPLDREPRPLLGSLESIPVVQIVAGTCYLVALAFQPTGMSVYSLGCGLGGKLGHGSTTDEMYPRLIKHFQTLNFQPTMIAGGAWHLAALGRDGRVCTWGWGNYGALGHGSEEPETFPRVVEALREIKAVHVAAGNCTTFVISDDGDIYSFGFGCPSLGHSNEAGGISYENVLTPKVAASLKKFDWRAEHISPARFTYNNAHLHTLVVTDSGKLYAMGGGEMGQLGVELGEGHKIPLNPVRVDIDLGSGALPS